MLSRWSVVLNVGRDHSAVTQSGCFAGCSWLWVAVYPVTATPSKQPGRVSNTVYVLAPILHALGG